MITITTMAMRIQSSMPAIIWPPPVGEEVAVTPGLAGAVAVVEGLPVVPGDVPGDPVTPGEGLCPVSLDSVKTA